MSDDENANEPSNLVDFLKERQERDAQKKVNTLLDLAMRHVEYVEMVNAYEPGLWDRLQLAAYREIHMKKHEDRHQKRKKQSRIMNRFNGISMIALSGIAGSIGLLVGQAQQANETATQIAQAVYTGSLGLLIGTSCVTAYFLHQNIKTLDQPRKYPDVYKRTKELLIQELINRGEIDPDFDPDPSPSKPDHLHVVPD